MFRTFLVFDQFCPSLDMEKIAGHGEQARPRVLVDRI
jgi:hypothetical protein